MTAPASAPPGTPTPEQLQQLKRVREAALLKKWTSGRTLALEEMAEIAHVLPPGLLAKPPPPKPGYLHDYAYYAAQLGYDVRNIKRLVGLGKVARVLPPFDEPAKLADWWEHMKILGHLKQQVPRRILDLVAREQQPVPASAVPVLSAALAGEPTGDPKPPVVPASPRVNFAELEAIGLEDAVRELTIQLSAAQKSLREAREQGLDDVIVNRRQKNFDTTLDSLRKTEKAWQELRKDRGDLAPISDFRKDITVIATTLRGMAKHRADNVCAKLGSVLTPEQVALVRAAIAAESEREQALLRSARHWTPPAS